MTGAPSLSLQHTLHRLHLEHVNEGEKHGPEPWAVGRDASASC